MILRRRFSSIVAAQLDLFVLDQAALIRECEEAERSYDAADREGAEERYGDYLDLVETGTEILADMRDHYAANLEEQPAEAYVSAFNRAVARRLGRFALEIENR